MTDPQNPDDPQVEAPMKQLVIEATGLLRAPEGIFVAITLTDREKMDYFVALSPATAEALVSRLSALTKSAYWVKQGGETLEPIIDMA